MKRLLVAGAALALIVVSQTGSWAGELTPEQQQEVRKIVQETLQGGGGPDAPPPGSGSPIFGDTSKQHVTYGTNFSGGSTLQGGRTIYAKPFVRAPKTIVGGYIDFTITDCNGDSQDCDRGLDFDQERFVPFFYSQVTDRLSVAAEVEFEHGGTNGNQSGDGEIT